MPTLVQQNSAKASPVRLAAWLGLGALALGPLTVAAHFGMFNSLFRGEMVGLGGWGTLLIFICTRPGRRAFAAVGGAGLLVRALYDFRVGEPGYPGVALIGLGAFLGPVSLAALLVRAMRAEGRKDPVTMFALKGCGLCFYLGCALGFYIAAAQAMLPLKYDQFLWLFEGRLGLHPSVGLARWAILRPWIGAALVHVYNALPFTLAALYAAYLKDRDRWPVDILRILILNGIFGYSLYFLYPAAGPKFLFPSFPNVTALGAAHLVSIAAVPNAMPSLHFAGALLLVWLSRPWRWLQMLSVLFLGLTACATLGLGEHYLIDLIVAIPYTLAVFGIGSNVRGRGVAIGCGAAMVGAWLVILRFPPPSYELAALLVVATIAISAAMCRKLSRQIWPELYIGNAASLPERDIYVHRAGRRARLVVPHHTLDACSKVPD